MFFLAHVTLWDFEIDLLTKLHNTHNRILTELMLKFSPAKMEAEKQADQEESHIDPSLLSLSTGMQSLSINMEVDTPTPQEDGGTMFRVTLIRLRWFLPICEFHLKSDDAVDHAYKYIQERFLFVFVTLSLNGSSVDGDSICY